MADANISAIGKYRIIELVGEGAILWREGLDLIAAELGRLESAALD
jgi:hypothetical protein